MKKVVLIFLVFFILVSCKVNTSEERLEGNAFLQQVEAVMVEGATLGDVRPSANELTEKEIMLKVAETVIERGYYNEKSADEIEPRLKNSRIATPEYVYSTNPHASGPGGYVICAVDSNGGLVATLTCNADRDSDKDHFIGSWGPCSRLNHHALTKKEITELLEEKMPEKYFTEPALVSIKLNGCPFYDTYWYVATTDGGTGEISRSVFANSDANVEEYLISGAIENYVPSKSGFYRSLTSNSSSDTNIWDGIMKVEGELGFYKVIEANKTIVDEKTRSVRAVSEDPFYQAYRGKSLSSVYSGQVIATETDL